MTTWARPRSSFVADTARRSWRSTSSAGGSKVNSDPSYRGYTGRCRRALHRWRRHRGTLYQHVGACVPVMNSPVTHSQTRHPRGLELAVEQDLVRLDEFAGEPVGDEDPIDVAIAVLLSPSDETVPPSLLGQQLASATGGDVAPRLRRLASALVGRR